MTMWPAAAAIALVLAARPDARERQVEGPRFEAATIKVHDAAAGTDTGVRVQPGQFRATNVTLRELVELAYGIPHPLGRVRIAGGPAWLDQSRFDVIAKAQNSGPPGELLTALRALLADRFHLATHQEETRELSIYALVTTDRQPARTSRAGLTQSSVACDTIPRLGLPAAPSDVADPPPCVLMHTPGRLAGTGITIAALIANGLSRVVDDRVIVDRTELSGRFDVRLEWTPDQKEVRPPPIGSPAPFLNAGPPDGPSFFTALQEQAGLKLQPTIGPVEVLVIDQADRPTLEP